MKTPPRDKLIEVYQLLLRRYGKQHWWPGEEPFEVIVGAILTQSTNWQNVEKALANLKKAGVLDARVLAELTEQEIAALVRPAGFFNAKSRKLKAFCLWLRETYNSDLDRLFALDIPILRHQLLSVYGIGDETADSIILYAAGKPIFVVDAYTKRILHRLGMGPSGDDYAEIQDYFMDSLPHDTALFNEFHALFVRHGKEVCRKSPLCSRCCLNHRCCAFLIDFKKNVC
jgi:endonuclease-3 related protein